MNNSKESIIAELRAYLSAELPYPTLAERAEAGGAAPLAHFLRGIHASEAIRRKLMLHGIVEHQDDLLDLYVCPHCGLLFIPEPPATCPVDETPGKDFIHVE